MAVARRENKPLQKVEGHWEAIPEAQCKETWARHLEIQRREKQAKDEEKKKQKR